MTGRERSLMTRNVARRDPLSPTGDGSVTSRHGLGVTPRGAFWGPVTGVGLWTNSKTTLEVVMSKISMLAAGAAGYVLGTRAGREQYDKMATQARKVWRDPKVQRKAGQAQEAAGDLGHRAGDKITSKVKEKTGGDAGGTSSDPLVGPSSSTSGTDAPHAPGGTTAGGGPYG